MIAMDTSVYTEASTRPEPRHIPLSHLSVEVGHLYLEHLTDIDMIRWQFDKVVPWLAAARQALARDLGGIRPRLSTCFLIDDYFRTDPGPEQTVSQLLEIAGEFDIQIDYLAREAACFADGHVPLAEATAAMLLPEPPVGMTGSRPPVEDSGWLCNGERSPDTTNRQAMMPPAEWRPAVEFGRRNHSIFVDVELWKDRTELIDGRQTPTRLWSCPFLASVWQLLRLGALRYEGDAVAQPRTWSGPWPDRWGDLPGVIQLTETAAPFAAYRATSILPRTYLGIEHSTQVILGHLDLDEKVITQTVERGRAEGVRVPTEITDRLTHVFIEKPPEPEC